MINLNDIGHSIFKLPHEASINSVSAWGTSANSLFFACGPTKSNTEIKLYEVQSLAAEGQNTQLIAAWESPHDELKENSEKLVNLHYFADDLSFCLILNGGDTFIVRREPDEYQSHVEIAGSIDAGIAAAAWSPDEELLALVTSSKSFLLMSRNYDPVHEVEISPNDLKSSNHVSVGWGAAETQFKGRRAKGLRDPTVPEKVDAGSLSHLDKGEIIISWRGDGAYVAINSIDDEKRRTIRVYGRDGLLDSISEPLDGLEGSLSWRPSGNLLAGVQRLSDRASVVFFERNGLRHGEFSLRLTKDDLSSWASEIRLAWNSDSSILGIQFKDRIQLWMMKNYHYYLKKEINNLGSEFESSFLMEWHPESPYILHKCYGGIVEVMGYAPGFTRQDVTYHESIGLVGVVDGVSLKLTPLGLTNIPPPMALHEVNLTQNIVDIAFNDGGFGFAVLHGNGISTYHYKFNNHNLSPPNCVNSCDLPNKDRIFRQIRFMNDSSIVVLTTNTLNGKDGVLLMSLQLNSFREFEFNHNAPISMIQPICRTPVLLWLDINGGIGHIVVQEGQIEREQVKIRNITKLPSRMQRIETVGCVDRDHINSECYHTSVVALATNGNLYYIKQYQGGEFTLLTKGCTSFVVSSSFLIITTVSHFLKFIPFMDDLVVPPDEPEKNEYCRSIERGAVIVTAIPRAQCLVLQMPRGNLETIYPRAFVLSSIRKFIMAGDYMAAFSMCRKHKVDFNILFDYAPDRLMNNVGNFVEQVRSSDNIDLFLTNLREEDVCKSLYGNTTLKSSEQSERHVSYERPKENGSCAYSRGKVNAICDAFLHYFQALDGKYLQNEITAYTCKVPQDLEAALRTVSSYKGNETGVGEKAVEHICFLADVNQLYESALGLYDLALALVVAQKSQKDPREYMPYLQNLQKMELQHRQFTIDDDLRRYVKALKHLHAMAQFEKFAIYTEKHALYEQALSLCSYESDRVHHLTGLYAAYLSSNNRHREAGLAYDFLQNYSAASTAYKLALMWQECLSSASLIPLSADDMNTLANDLCGDLVESKNYHAAALIYLDYLGSVDSATRLLCKGYMFSEAIRIAILRQQAELLIEVIDPALVETSGSMTEILAEIKGQIEAQVPRIRVLREKKAEDPASFFAGSADTESDNIPDNLSLAASSTIGSTLITRYTSNSMNTAGTDVTRRTSKNKRREERKRARGKKGSVYEEEYLVASMRRLFERVNSMAEDEVNHLIDALFRRGMRQRAMAVQNAMLDVVKLCQACQDQVFQVVPEPAEGQVHAGKEHGGAENASGVEGNLQAENMNGVSISPGESGKDGLLLIKPFAKLSLLS